MSAVPARSPLARFGAWARESLLARAIAVLLGLGVLALIGGSALAGGPKPPASNPPPAPSSTALGAAVEVALDAGSIPTTRPELLPRVLPEDVPPPSDTTAVTTTVAGRVTRATPSDPVDLNTARVDDLRRLPGIGAKRAEAILALRARLPGSHFRQVEDLLRVKGIGRSMLKRLHPLVRLSGAEVVPEM